MAKKPETKFGEKIDLLLRNIPGSVWFNIQQKSIRGTPDRIGCINGIFVALELKKSEEDYKLGMKKQHPQIKLQANNLRKINAAGGYGSFLYPENWETIYQDLLHISEGKLPAVGM